MFSTRITLEDAMITHSPRFEPPLRIDIAALKAFFELPDVDLRHTYMRVIVTPPECTELSVRDVTLQVHDDRETSVDATDVPFEQHGIRFFIPRSAINLLVDASLEVSGDEIVLRHPLSDHYEVNQHIPERWEGLGARLLVVKSYMFGEGVFFTQTYEGRNYVVAFPYSASGWQQAARVVLKLVAIHGEESRPKVSQLYQALGAEFLLTKDLGGFVVIPEDGTPHLYSFGG